MGGRSRELGDTRVQEMHWKTRSEKWREGKKLRSRE